MHNTFDINDENQNILQKKHSTSRIQCLTIIENLSGNDLNFICVFLTEDKRIQAAKVLNSEILNTSTVFEIKGEAKCIFYSNVEKALFISFSNLMESVVKVDVSCSMIPSQSAVGRFSQQNVVSFLTISLPQIL